MLLRSSSTPVLGSLISSISESPNHHHHHPSDIHHPNTVKNPPTTNNHNPRLSYHQPGSLRNTYSCNSSPVSPAVVDLSGGGGRNGVQRTLSEGNLQGLAHDLSHPDEFTVSNLSKKFSRKPNYCTLEPIPSVSLYRSRSRLEDQTHNEEEEEEEEEEDESCGVFANSSRIVENSMENSNEDNKKWDFNEAYRNLGLGENKQQIPELYLARGLGVGGGVNIGFGVNETGGAIHGGGGGGGGEFVSVAFGRGDDGGNNRGVEEHYQKLVEENPGNPLCLRNYAQFLYESKKDLPRAEEYYSRAILADPKDGEVLSQMAKLVWELHHDLTRASNYFHRAVQAAPEDSHVHASYASFLWETEEDEEEQSSLSGASNPSAIPTRFNTIAHASAAAY